MAAQANSAARLKRPPPSPVTICTVSKAHPKGWIMPSQTFPRTRSHRNRSAWPLAIFTLSTMLLLSGCAALGGGISQSQSGEETENAEPTAPTVRDDESAEATSRQSPARSETGASEDEATPGGNRANRAGDGEAVLRLTGSSGTKFSGECEVGGERESIEGELPERFTFDLGDGGLACDIEKRGSGQMQVVFSAGNNNVVQTAGADNATISFVYEDGNVSVSQSSSSSSSIQQSSGTSVTQSNVVIQNGTSSSNPNP